jgi:hypothetical protein
MCGQMALQPSYSADVTGKVLLTKAINNKGEIDLSQLTNSTYYLQNRTTGESQKIVVNK